MATDDLAKLLGPPVVSKLDLALERWAPWAGVGLSLSGSLVWLFNGPPPIVGPLIVLASLAQAVAITATARVARQRAAIVQYAITKAMDAGVQANWAATAAILW